MTLRKAFEHYLVATVLSRESHASEWRNAYFQAKESELQELCDYGESFFRFIEYLFDFEIAMKVYSENTAYSDYNMALQKINQLEQEVKQLRGENLKIKEAVATLLNCTRSIDK